jgi:hypothetical protein
MSIIFFPMFLIGLICFIYLGYQDLKYREINIVPLLVISAIGFAYYIFFGLIKGFLYMYILQIAISFAFLTIIYVLGKFTVYAYIGEGDLIALMTMSFISGISVLFTGLVFLMSTVLTLFFPILFLIYNTIKGNFPKKPLGESLILMSFGFPKAINKLTNFYTPLEEYKLVNNKVISKTTIKPNCSPEQQIYELKKFSKIHRIDKIWVSPLVPFVLILTIAYAIVSVLTYFNVLSLLGNFATSFI